jgi:hypothetical protein
MSMSNEHVRRYGRIEIGGSPMQQQYRGVSWSLPHYQDAVVAQLQALWNTRTGRIILDAITRRLLIVPWQDPSHDDAAARPVSEQGFLGFVPTTLPRDRRNAAMYGEWVDPNRSEVGVGTGRGSAVVIEYTPGMWAPGSPIATQFATPTRAQQVLLHELVHAIRMMRGLLDRRTAQNRLAGYDDRDEFHAILITNIHCCQMGIHPLRRNHHGYQPLLNPAAFYHQPHNKLMVMDLCREMPDITRALASIVCTFNPIRDYCLEMGLIAA